MSPTRSVPNVRSLTRLGPHSGAHRVATRAGLGVLAPLLLLTLTDHVHWCVYAAFGALAGLYGRHHDYAPRARMQAGVGLLLAAAVTTGVATASLPHARWWAVAGAALWAGIGGLASDAWSWHPPGALFVVFAYAVCAQLPVAGGDVPVALAVSAGSAAFALLLGVLGTVLPFATPVRAVAVGPGWVVAVRRTGAGAHVLRLVVAAGSAGAVATAAGLGHPYWATVAAVVPMAARNTTERLQRAQHRVIGTGAGLVLAAGLLPLRLSTVGLVALLAALQVLAELFVGRNYALALVFVTPLALLIGQLGQRLPEGPLLRDRAVETLLGVTAAVVLTLLTRDRDAAA